MRVLLVGPDQESNLSLRYLASSLRAAGHAPVLAPFDTAADAPAVRAAARGTDLVGLSMCFQVRALEFLDLAAALKRDAPGRPIVAGGHHASCAAAELIAQHPALDAIVVHEGEETLVELANLGDALAARAGEVQGVVVRVDGGARFTAPRPALADLDRLPRPDRSGPARLLCGVPTAYLMGSRGCVNDCDYCCITTLHRLAPGPRFRQRTPEDVADEMAELYHERGVRQFVFHDDNFLVPSAGHNHARVGRLDAALRERDVRDIGLVLKCSPRDAERSVLERLRRMGLLRLFMGIESGSACGLASIGRRQTVADSERALALCEELGISTQYTMIILHPEATVDSMLADLAFVARHPAHPLNYCRAEIYAGTPLEARMLAEGRAEGSYLGRTYRYTDPRVATVWEVGRELFAGRCWGKDELLGAVIRLDHQVAVLDRFYEGRGARELARAFAAWQVELNLETAAFFRELVLACADATGPGDVTLARAVAEIHRREAPSREARLREVCAFRARLERYAHLSVELGRRHARAAGRSILGPRHAAAVAAAIGMLGCAVAHDRGIQEAAPPPVDPRPPPCPPAAPGEGVLQGPPDYREDQGVAEAAPPPLDPGPARRAAPPRYRHDQGVAEAAPPPYVHDRGVAEAAPPPIPRLPRSVVVWTDPAVPACIAGARVALPYALELGGGAALDVAIGTGNPPNWAHLRAARATPGFVALRIAADRPLLVRYGDRPAMATPAQLAVPISGERLPIVVEDPATGARVVVHAG